MRYAQHPSTITDTTICTMRRIITHVGDAMTMLGKLGPVETGAWIGVVLAGGGACAIGCWYCCSIATTDPKLESLRFLTLSDKNCGFCVEE